MVRKGNNSFTYRNASSCPFVIVCIPLGPPRLWPCNLSTGAPSSFKARVLKSYLHKIHKISYQLRSVYEYILLIRQTAGLTKPVWLTKGYQTHQSLATHTFHTSIVLSRRGMRAAFSTSALKACCLQGTEQPVNLHTQ